ncbi:MAG: AzlD domain-containing protein [Mobilicoccus sp.]|nr:AzlD domain-containing protein [Mobilicoccus sp.]
MSDTDRWLLIAGLAVITFTLKGIGPLALGGRDLPEPMMRVIRLLAPPLLCALVVTAVFATGTRLTVGAETVGVAVAGLLLWRTRIPLIGAALVAMTLTAVLRAF